MIKNSNGYVEFGRETSNWNNEKHHFEHIYSYNSEDEHEAKFGAWLISNDKRREALRKVMYYPNKTFRAKDIGLSGARLTNFTWNGIVKIVGHEDCWYQIDEDTMKRGCINIYALDTTKEEISDLIKKGITSMTLIDFLQISI